MTETITERDILKRLKSQISRVPKDAPVDDWVVAMSANKLVLGLVLDSQQPINKTRAFYQRAEKQLDDLENYINQREEQNWFDESQGQSQKVRR